MHVVILPMSNFEVQREPLAAIFQLHQAQALHGAGFKVGIVNPGLITTRFLLRRYPYSEKEMVGGIPVYRRYRRLFFPGRLRDAWHFNELLASMGVELLGDYIASHGTPDILHAHNAIPVGAVAKSMSTAYDIPYVITEHNSALLTQAQPASAVHQYVAAACASAHTVLAVGEALKQVLVEEIGLPVEKVKVLANVLDPQFLHPAMMGSRRAGFTFLNIGNLIARKDHELLIRAFAICGFDSDVVLKIGGDGPLRPRLTRLVETLGLGDQILFLGPLSRQDVRDQMSAADTFVLSSQAETFGVVLVEALACGTPVISTDCGGPTDIVSEDCGILTPVGDVSALARAMRTVHAEVARFDRGNIRRACLERYGPDRFVSELRAIYEHAVCSAKTGSS